MENSAEKSFIVRSDLTTFFFMSLLLLFMTSLGYLAICFPLEITLPLILLTLSLLWLMKTGILTPLHQPAFMTLKVISISVATAFCPLVAANLLPPSYIESAFTLILAFNMAEAVIFDWKKKNYFNAMAGAWLIFLIPLCFHISWVGDYFVISPNQLIFWIAGYTLWNWLFLMFNFPRQSSLFHVFVLLSPLLIALWQWNVGLWLVMRTVTLLIAIIIRMSFAYPFLSANLKFSFYETICHKLIENTNYQNHLAIAIIFLGTLSIIF